jgi:hypothetical protein
MRNARQIGAVFGAPTAAFLAVSLLALAGCRGPEPREAAEARAWKALYEKQISGLEETLARARKDGISRDRILIGISEQVFREVVRATLPQEVVLKDRVRLRLEKADTYFRYTQGVVVFDGRLTSVKQPKLFIAVRLAGGIDRVDFTDGRLSALVKLYWFEVLGSALGDMGKAVVEAIVRDNMNLVTDVIPPIAIPVRLEQGLAIKGLSEGPVSVSPGTLPFSASVARLTSLNGRLWIGLEIKAGPWKSGAEVADAGKAGAEAKVGDDGPETNP